MFRCLTIALSLAAAVAIGVRPAAAEDKKHPHPHLLHALHELREAHKELSASSQKYGGHKAAALKDMKVAIEQIEICLKEHGGHDFPKDFTKHIDYTKHKHHPHLHEALHELREANVELSEASHNFGGHREAAKRAVEEATKQVELCLRHAK